MRGQAHVDHYSTGSLVRDAVKMARLEKTIPDLPRHEIQKIFFYMIPRNILPNLYVDISNVIDKAFDVICAYQSQMAIGSGMNDIKHVLSVQRAAMGLLIGVKYAECFVSELPLRITAEQFFQI
jgi:LmbE family N-acetylglucosaminyl deacetylase